MAIVRLFGVRVVLSPGFLVLLAVCGAAGLFAEAALLFGVVLMHELAHAAAARLCGLAVAEVELLPFGGVARLEAPLEIDPAVEVKVALSGPLANAAAIAFALLAQGVSAFPFQIDGRFIEANAVIGGFNLIPALPLDGGRVYRAWLVPRVGFRRATERAARLGRSCGIGMAGAGALLLSLGHASISLPAVGLFLFLAARRESEEAPYVLMRYLARRREALRRNPLAPARHLAASEETPVKQVLDTLVPQRYHIVWVLGKDGRLAGVAGEIELVEALFQRGVDTPVGAVAVPLRGWESGEGRSPSAGASGGNPLATGLWD